MLERTEEVFFNLLHFAECQTASYNILSQAFLAYEIAVFFFLNILYFLIYYQPSLHTPFLRFESLLAILLVVLSTRKR